MVLKLIRCADIRPGERRDREKGAPLDALADSIERCGVLRPVLLRASDEGYVIVHGERRWRAARKIGLEVIPAYLVQDYVREEHAAGPQHMHGRDAA